uniref:GH26608p n=1 Tax=Drosophila melanogaster TaxID=7227 RepID=Q8SWT0_DROME|nr:GH26608p [Drosophila melanogaster]
MPHSPEAPLHDELRLYAPLRCGHPGGQLGLGQERERGAAPAYHGPGGLQVHHLPREIRSHPDLHQQHARRRQVPAESIHHPLGPEGSGFPETLLLHHRHQGGALARCTP